MSHCKISSLLQKWEIEELQNRIKKIIWHFTYLTVGCTCMLTSLIDSLNFKLLKVRQQKVFNKLQETVDKDAADAVLYMTFMTVTQSEKCMTM